MQAKRKTVSSMTQNKLLLLRALAELGPVTGEQALRFVVDLGLMSYMDYALALAELADAQLLLPLDEEPGRAYHITRRGEEALSFFARRAPHSKLAAIAEAAPAWRETFRHESLYKTEIITAPSGQYAVRLLARSAAEPIVELTLYVSQRQQAEAIAAAWPRRAGEVYGLTLDALTRPDDAPG